ncbi:MAG: energy-coupling factor transporter transmembrane component T family protein [Bacillota bacterium]
MLVEYRKRDTYLHKSNPKVLLLGTLIVIVASILWTHPIYCGVMLGLLIILGQVAKFPWSQIKWFFKVIIIPVVFIMVIQAFSLDTSLLQTPYKDVILFYLLPGQRLGFNLGGLLYGLAASMKIYMVVLAVAILGYTVSPSDFIQMISRVRFASRQFVFIFSTAWRFIPIIQKQITHLLDAQKTRGMELDKGKLGERVRKLIPIVTPLLSNSLETGDQIALSMEARAFGAKTKSKFIKPMRYTLQDRLLFYLLLIMLALMIFAYTQGYGVL